MLHSRFGFAILLALALPLCNVSVAQQQSGESTDADVGLDFDEAFSNIERGSTIGSTGSTGLSFSDASATSEAGGGSGAGGGRLGGGGFGGGLGGLAGLFGNAGATQQAKPVIRTRLRSAISGPPLAPALVQQTVTQHLRALPAESRIRGVNVQMRGRTAVISGVVRSERDRRMSELMLRLEPGVRNIENQLVVSQP